VEALNEGSTTLDRKQTSAIGMVSRFIMIEP
jgi:hypothetical protein